MISIIIPVKNLFSRHLYGCLESIKMNTKIPYEIILIEGDMEKDSSWTLAGAWNAGIRATRGDKFVIMNDDVLVPPQWLKKLARYSVACPYYTETEGATEIKHKKFTGFCFLMSKKVYKIVGPFDERFKFTSEDSDYQIRLRKAGYEPTIVDDVVVTHLLEQSHPANIEELIKEGRKLFNEKHKGVQE